MKIKHPSKLKVGDRVGNGTAMRGVVTMAAKRGEYVRIAWTSARREDTLSVTSPLWLVLELEK